MLLEVNRKEFYEDRTIGGLYINGHWGYFVLEDVDRQRVAHDGSTLIWASYLKIPKETAIPRGKYKLTISWSNRFRRLMPHILDVPDFTGIRIHIGNYPGDTEGCPIIGKERDVKTNNLLRSKEAFDEFFAQLESWLIKEDVWIEIS